MRRTSSAKKSETDTPAYTSAVELAGGVFVVVGDEGGDVSRVSSSHRLISEDLGIFEAASFQRTADQWPIKFTELALRIELERQLHLDHDNTLHIIMGNDESIGLADAPACGVLEFKPRFCFDFGNITVKRGESLEYLGFIAKASVLRGGTLPLWGKLRRLLGEARPPQFMKLTIL